MKKMMYRIANLSDAKALAQLHYACSVGQQGGFMHKLGIPFLIKYYQIIINNKFSVIILAEDLDGVILGFHSGTLDANEHYSSLRKNRHRFLLPIFVSLIKRPKMLPEIYMRYRYTRKDSSLKFGIKTGVRGEYWGWSPNNPNAVESINLHRIWHRIIKQLGATSVRSEVDIVNDRVVKSIEIMGGVFLEEITLHDGRKRAIVEYDLLKY